jgi:transcriptional regulator with PAS, ATPase and Fis domain
MKIAFICPYKELKTLVEDVSAEIAVKVDVFEAAFEAAANIARKLETQKYDIIISRGATYWTISKCVKIPIIKCNITSFDILYAIYEASKFSKNIAFIIYEPMAFNSKLIAEILDINLICINSYKASNELMKIVEEVIAQGAEVVIGGILTKQYAEKLGRRGILLQTSPETVRQVISNAVEIYNLSRQKMLEAERLNHIINFSYEGIIVTDSKGIVTVFNPAAEKILGIKAEDIINNRADKYIPTTGMIEVASSGNPQIGTIQKVKNTTIVTSRVPIKFQDEVLGAVATFQDIGKIMDWEIKIRSEIYKKGLVARYTFDNYFGSSEGVKKLIAKAKKYTETDSTVLIIGESGTGKEILAQSIHNGGGRKDYPFVAVNCSAIPEHLLESELFGYEEGAFTGAKKGGKIGLFELAHRGTIFLDEIGSISKSLQANLLRVLQEKEVWRIGSNKVIQIDVRVIAATNSDLLEAVEKGEFRHDLYYRLNVLNLHTIPLRSRREDVIELFHHFMKSYCGSICEIDKENERLLKEYNWPGNVRELQNFVERFILLKKEITLGEILKDVKIHNNKKEIILEETKAEGDTITIKKGSLKEMEKEIISMLYKEHHENATLLAQKLNISRTTLWKRIKEFRIC